MSRLSVLRRVVAFVSVVFVGLVACPATVRGQSTFDTNPGDHNFSAFGTCFNDAAAAAIDSQTHEPNAPADGSSVSILNPETFLEASWKCSLEYADRVFVPGAKRLLYSLALLMLIWYGVQHMLGRGLNMASLLNYFMLIGFALIILDNYHTPTHNFFPPNSGFVQVIARQVVGWSQDIYQATERDFDAAFAQTRRVLDEGAAGAKFQAENNPDDAEDAASRAPPGSLVDRINSPFGDAPSIGVSSLFDFDGLKDRLSSFLVSALAVTMQRVVGLVLWIIRWMLVAQYMWGFFMLSLLSLLGPLFVPAIVISQIDWLFWNWLRGLLSACVYMLSSAALYSVSMILLLTPLARINSASYTFEDPDAGVGAALIWLAVGFLEYIPIFFLVGYMSLQAGTVASGLMSGSGPSSLTMATRALTRGVSYTLGAAPVIASGMVQRGARGAMAGLSAYRFARGLGSGGHAPGSGDPGDGSSGDPRGGPSGGSSIPSPSGSGGSGADPRTASMGPGGIPGSPFGGSKLSAPERAAVAARLTMETNVYLDARVADRLSSMGDPAVGGGALDRLREAERVQLFDTTQKPDGTFETTGPAAQSSGQQVPPRQEHLAQAARIASLHHVLLWDDVAHRQSDRLIAGPAQAAQAAQAAEAAKAAAGEAASPGLYERARNFRDGVHDNLRSDAPTVDQLGTDFNRRVRDTAERKGAESVDWVRQNAQKRWKQYWDAN